MSCWRIRKRRWVGEEGIQSFQCSTAELIDQLICARSLSTLPGSYEDCYTSHTTINTCVGDELYKSVAAKEQQGTGQPDFGDKRAETPFAQSLEYRVFGSLLEVCNVAKNDSVENADLNGEIFIAVRQLWEVVPKPSAFYAAVWLGLQHWWDRATLFPAGASNSPRM